MGREVRRVPLDFDWPLNKVWRGFINPHYKFCPEEATGQCSGGSNAGGQWLDAIARFIAAVGDDGRNGPESRKSGRIWPHPYLRQFSQRPKCDPPRMFAELTEALAGRKPSFIGHDACDAWTIYKKILAAAGLSEDWGHCKVCGGHGIDPAVREAYEAWEKEDPPSGDGWQLWETVSEGSPISPVFAASDGLVGWLVENGHSRKSAEAFVKAGWAPSAVAVGGKMYDSIDSVAAMKENDG